MKGFTLHEVMAGLAILFGIILAVLLFGCTRGIVGLEGYEHGVAFCGKDIKFIAHSMDAYCWHEDNTTFVVNKGHLHDPQVAKLKELARQTCK